MGGRLERAAEGETRSSIASRVCEDDTGQKGRRRTGWEGKGETGRQAQEKVASGAKRYGKARKKVEKRWEKSY